MPLCDGWSLDTLYMPCRSSGLALRCSMACDRNAIKHAKTASVCLLVVLSLRRLPIQLASSTMNTLQAELLCTQACTANNHGFHSALLPCPAAPLPLSRRSHWVPVCSCWCRTLTAASASSVRHSGAWCQACRHRLHGTPHSTACWATAVRRCPTMTHSWWRRYGHR